ncbi:MAG: hypothetical protein QOK23_2590 [Gammaproteobacteria bacterium]|jgi:hypothetical protein|nr:hypothetical protein [Gammaproteobacteria bacterium]
MLSLRGLRRYPPDGGRRAGGEASEFLEYQSVR